MRYASRLPSVPVQFCDRVREECVKAALSGNPTTYEPVATAVIGDADRGSEDRRSIRLVIAALTENMRDDAKAGRPLSAVAVRVAGTGVPGVPGEEFFTRCWELGRFHGDQSAEEFVKNEWDRFQLYVKCNERGSDDQSPSIAA